MEDEEIALMLRSAVPIDDVDRLMFGPADGLAIVWLDISERPDLQVLADRHAAGEDGYCICTWFYHNPGKRNMLIGLRVEMRRPTRTVFHLAFKVRDYIDQLMLVGRAGKLWIVPGPPPSHLVGTMEMTASDFVQKVVNYSGQGVMLELEPHLVAELRDQLAAWERANK